MRALHGLASLPIVLTLLAGTGALAQSEFRATLTGAQASAGAGTGSMASGVALMELSAGEDSFTYAIQIDGLDLDGLQTMTKDDDVTALHFHNAPPGVNGPIAFGLISPNHDVDDLVIDAAAGTLMGVWEETDTNPLSSFLADLKAGNLYLNVHTDSFGGGEIRGQVEPVVFADGFETGDTTAWTASTP